MNAIPAILRGASTPTVSDALDFHDLPGQIWGPRRLSGGAPVCGPAYTVRFAPVEPGASAPAADYIDDVPEGAVVVLAGSGEGRTVWGDLLAETALRRGVAATVIDGYCRDIDAIAALGYPLWAKGAFMRSGKNRVRMAAVGEPVEVGPEDDRVTVAPGDLICADGSGVVRVPADAVEAVARTAERIAAMEEKVLADVRSGLDLSEARRRHRYNSFAKGGAQT